LLVALGLSDGDQPGSVQSVDRPVQADALADVDDLVFAPLLEQALDAVRVQRLRVQHAQHGEGKRGAADFGAHGSDINSRTSVKRTS
jgi:hypothetical protein